MLDYTKVNLTFKYSCFHLSIKCMCYMYMKFYIAVTMCKCFRSVDSFNPIITGILAFSSFYTGQSLGQVFKISRLNSLCVEDLRFKC